MFKNMKIGVRLGVGFGLVVLLMIVIATIGITRMAILNASLDNVNNDKWPKVLLLQDGLSGVNVISLGGRDILIAADRHGVQTAKEEIYAGRASLGKAWEKLKPTLLEPEGMRMFELIISSRTRYVAAQDQLIKLAEEGRIDEGRSFMGYEFRPAAEEYRQRVNNLIEFQGALMNDLGREAAEQYNQARTLMFAMSVIAFLLAAAIAYWVTRSITRPLEAAVGVANQLADGDLTAHIEIDSTDETGQLLSAMQNMVDKLSQIIGEVRGAADNLSSASEEVSATAQSMSQASSEQAASVEETSASIEQMSASINQNAENAKVTDGMASQAARQATEGGEAVESTVAAMNQIASKIGIIDDIAYQTNLLALNAAIEAARAGEHGKGFAVVAAEVRKLAERSQIAAREIGEVASSSVELAERAGRLLDEIVPAINNTSDLVQEIAAASGEQSAGATQINAAIGQLNQITQQNASSSEELAATSEEMSSQAEQLQQTMSFFRVENMPLIDNKKIKDKAKPKAVVSQANKKASSYVQHDDEHEFVRF